MTFDRTSKPRTPPSTFGRRPNTFNQNTFADAHLSGEMSRDMERIAVCADRETGSRKTALWFGVAFIAIGAMTYATAQSQSASPFARKKAKQAWETYTAPPSPQAPAPATVNTQANTPIATMSNSTASTTFEPYAKQPVSNSSYPTESYQTEPYQGGGTYTPPTQTPRRQTAPSEAARTQFVPQPKTSNGLSTYSSSQIDSINSGKSGTYYPGRSRSGPAPVASNANTSKYANASNSGYNRGYANTAPQNGSQQYAQQQYGTYGGQQTQPQLRGYAPQGKRSFFEKIGLGNLATSVSGFFKGGAAGTNRKSDDAAADTGWSEDFVLDAALRGEISAITQGGLEYGVGAEVRGQYDKYRRGFGGRVGDCPAGVAGCPSTLANGVTRAVRGHTSRFYTDGPDESEDLEMALEGAYVFLRSSYGDLTVGRDDGSAYLFSLGAPTLLTVGASNNSVDYTGLDSVKTINDASGFSEKIAYVSPRLLGDQIGVGVQVGVSYALNARACGVDYCVKDPETDGTGTLSPDLKNIIEAGIALDRKFSSGFSVEATATYAMAKEKSGFAAFDDLQSYGLGLDLGYHDWKLGGSYLQSNNGLMDGDYTAYDIGLTWEPGPLGFTIGYGHAKDDNVNLTSDQGIFGMNYDFGKYRLGTGVQYVDRKVPVNNGGTVTRQSEKATSIFVEGGFTF